MVTRAMVTEARAQDRPPMTATRDATVVYQTTGREAGQAIEISFGAASGLMRIDNPSIAGYAIVDRKGRRMTVVMTEMRMFMEMAAAGMPGQPNLPEEDAKFTRKGTDTIAGQSCTVWDFAAPNGTGSVCLTSDGILLRARTNDGSGMDATKVSYAAVPAANFSPPAGFMKMDMGALGGAAGMLGGGMPPGMRPPGR
jgi:hypothetical protein